MNKVSLVDNPLIAVWVYPERRLLHSQMKAYCFGPEFRAGLTAAAEGMERYQATRWLADDRASGALPPEDMEWGTQVWFPRALAAGWSHWALLQPAKLIGKIHMERVMQMFAGRGLKTRMFTDPDEAMRWLDED
jgi:hypothetical protein